MGTAAVAEVEAKEKAAPKAIYRKDYQPTPYLINTVDLDFVLNEDITHVHSKLHLLPNYKDATPPSLTLNGRSDVKLAYLKVNGAEVSEKDYEITEKTLTVKSMPAGEVRVEIGTDIKPQDNMLLEGLYKSGGNFCTQCEAEGFRGITFFLDRPDVMAKYTTRVEADKKLYPVLLSNGNLTDSGDLEGGRHYVVWVDPFPKPCYLFALVAGKLSMKETHYTTGSGRQVALRIFVAEKDLPKVDYALASLDRAMRWDEEVFGLEYDLDLYNIVAVDDFNMGAMENKSLNLFNSRLVLASPETATDGDYKLIEAVVGHEYFHNWTGNRVTCRDWFQLTLKEGLTVYRDQEFTSDMTSRPVKRIEDVVRLRTAQFTEDAGPVAHPVRPDSYIKMDNFYTVTVYEKGAEVVRLYERLLGKEGFRKGMDLYFQRHDGQAVTCDDFLSAMADANGVDLSALSAWYSQAGTPRVKISSTYDAAAATLTLSASQSTPATPGQPEKVPVLIPLAVGLLSPSGADMPLRLQDDPADLGTTTTLRLESPSQQWVFTGVTEEPVLSVLRDFSAPVLLEVEGQSEAALQLMFAHDSDPFNRWEAGQRLGKSLLLKLYEAGQDASLGTTVEERFVAAGGVSEGLVEAFRSVLGAGIDGSFTAMAISLPATSELITAVPQANPVLLHQVRSYINKQLASRLRAELEATVKANDTPPGEPYSPDATSSARRALKNKALQLLVSLEDPELVNDCLRRFREAGNMSDQLGALAALVDVAGPVREAALQEFYAKWQHEPLVVLKWLGIQAMSNAAGNVELVRSLESHPAFNVSNPNNCYSLYLGFARSPANFHAADGSGYQFLAEAVVKVDKLNHQVAARMATSLSTWRQLDAPRQALVKAQLQTILGTSGLSENVFEIVSKSLAD